MKERPFSAVFFAAKVIADDDDDTDEYNCCRVEKERKMREEERRAQKTVTVKTSREKRLLTAQSLVGEISIKPNFAWNENENQRAQRALRSGRCEVLQVMSSLFARF